MNTAGCFMYSWADSHRLSVDPMADGYTLSIDKLAAFWKLYLAPYLLFLAVYGMAQSTGADKPTSYLQGTDADLPTASEVQKAKEQRSKNAIPVIVSISSDSAQDCSSLRSADLDGIACSSSQLSSISQSFGNSQAESADAQVQAILNAVLASPEVSTQQDSSDHATSDGRPHDNGHKKPGLGKQFLSPAKEDLVEAERQLLQQVLGLLEQATPQMEEMSMLTDALKQLDELFLLVVVGEFNSGKSSVINALLGSRYTSAVGSARQQPPILVHLVMTLKALSRR